MIFSKIQRRGVQPSGDLRNPGMLAIAAFVLAGSTSAASASAADTPLSLADAVKEALRNQPQVQKSREKVLQSDAEVLKTWSSIFPTISAQAAASTRKDAVIMNTARFGGDSYNYYTTSLQLTQPLLVFGLVSGADVSQKARDISKLGVDVSERDITIQVIQNFYQVLLNQRNLETLRSVEKIQKESVTTTQRRQSIGRGQLIDLLQARTQLALIQPKLEQAESSLKVSAQQLATLLGHERPDVVTLKGSLLPPDERKVREIFEGKTSRIPEFEQLQLRRKQLDSQKSAALGKDLPSVQFSGNLSRGAYKSSDILNSAADSYNATVTLNIPIFSGLSSVQERKSYASQARQLALEEESLRQSLSLDQVKAREALQVAQRKIEVSSKAQELAKLSLEEAKRNYRLATIDLLQFLQVQQAYSEAENALDQARFEYLQALAQSAKAMGIDVAALVEILN